MCAMNEEYSKRDQKRPACAEVPLLDIDLHCERLDTRHTLCGILGTLLMLVNVHLPGERYRSIAGHRMDFLCMGAQFPLQFIGDVFLKLLVSFHLKSLSSET